MNITKALLLTVLTMAITSLSKSEIEETLEKVVTIGDLPDEETKSSLEDFLKQQINENFGLKEVEPTMIWKTIDIPDSRSLQQAVITIRRMRSNSSSLSYEGLMVEKQSNFVTITCADEEEEDCTAEVMYLTEDVKGSYDEIRETVLAPKDEENAQPWDDIPEEHRFVNQIFWKTHTIGEIVHAISSVHRKKHAIVKFGLDSFQFREWKFKQAYGICLTDFSHAVKEEDGLDKIQITDSSYPVPEYTNDEPYSSATDIFILGYIIYQILNPMTHAASPFVIVPCNDENYQDDPEGIYCKYYEELVNGMTVETPAERTSLGDVKLKLYSNIWEMAKHIKIKIKNLSGLRLPFSISIGGIQNDQAELESLPMHISTFADNGYLALKEIYRTEEDNSVITFFKTTYKEFIDKKLLEPQERRVLV